MCCTRARRAARRVARRVAGGGGGGEISKCPVAWDRGSRSISLELVKGLRSVCWWALRDSSVVRIGSARENAHLMTITMPVLQCFACWQKSHVGWVESTRIWTTGVLVPFDGMLKAYQ
jgi:hypothetical protein